MGQGKALVPGILVLVYNRLNRTGRGLGAVLGAGAALGAYTFVEPYLFRLTRKEVQLDLPETGSARTVDILHVSDAHLGRRQRDRARFLASLPERLERTPELILSTGDMIEVNEGIEPLLEALEPLKADWGKFYVNGSHDYYQARFQSYARYFDGEERRLRVPGDIDRLERGLEKMGWTSLTNRQEVLDTPIGRVRLAGVDDPYLKRHSTAHLRTEPDDVLRIGAMHAPDVVSEFALTGFDLILAGHTHGGQVRLPWFGAVVTNSSLPTELAMGQQRIGSAWLHVSPGIGNGSYSPIRFLARPEATLLRVELR